jgi:hypothetical protein
MARIIKYFNEELLLHSQFIRKVFFNSNPAGPKMSAHGLIKAGV